MVVSFIIDPTPFLVLPARKEAKKVKAAANFSEKPRLVWPRNSTDSSVSAKVNLEVFVTFPERCPQTELPG